MSPAPLSLPTLPALAQARVSLLGAQIRVLHHERVVAALQAAASGAPQPLQTAATLARLTQQLLDDGLVSPGELAVMHQRAQAEVSP